MRYQDIKAIATQLCSGSLSSDAWQKLAFDTWSEEDKALFLDAVSARCDLPIQTLSNILIKSFSDFSKQIEEAMTVKITHFQTHNYCKKIQETPLVLSRDEWIELACRFEEQKKSIVTASFFLNVLSELREIHKSDLITTMYELRKQPEREVKPTRERTVEEDVSEQPTKKFKSRYSKKDEDPSLLILEATTDNHSLQNKLKAKHVRCTNLNPASPEKGFSNLMYTPNATKVKPLCAIDGNRFFTPLSPMQYAPKKASKQALQKTLPKANHKQAQTREYSVTSKTITRGKTRTCSGKQVMGHSAFEFFEAEDHKIKGKAHLAHMQAHCINGSQTQDNLVPSSAAANYNTLELIELYSMDLVEQKKTDLVKVLVEPTYADFVNIPNVLTYTLKWTEKASSKNHNEIFYITPPSTTRLTHAMHQGVKTLRDDVQITSDADSSKKPGYK